MFWTRGFARGVDCFLCQKVILGTISYIFDTSRYVSFDNLMSLLVMSSRSIIRRPLLKTSLSYVNMLSFFVNFSHLNTYNRLYVQKQFSTPINLFATTVLALGNRKEINILNTHFLFKRISCDEGCQSVRALFKFRKTLKFLLRKILNFGFFEFYF